MILGKPKLYCVAISVGEVTSLGIPEPIVHWGHPLMMGIVVFVMGSAVAIENSLNLSYAFIGLEVSRGVAK